MHHIEGVDRNQISFIALEELVDQNSWARLVDIFVDCLPLSKLGFTKVDLKEEGRPPFHPAVLLKLYMYGYNIQAGSDALKEYLKAYLLISFSQIWAKMSGFKHVFLFNSEKLNRLLVSVHRA